MVLVIIDFQVQLDPPYAWRQPWYFSVWGLVPVQEGVETQASVRGKITVSLRWIDLRSNVRFTAVTRLLSRLRTIL